MFCCFLRFSQDRPFGTFSLPHPRARCKRNLAPRYVRRYRPYYFVGDLRDDRVSQPAQAVCPVGYPMSHSTHAGFSEPVQF